MNILYFLGVLQWASCVDIGGRANIRLAWGGVEARKGISLRHRWFPPMWFLGTKVTRQEKLRHIAMMWVPKYGYKAKRTQEPMH